jgi:hypothetical protein
MYARAGGSATLGVLHIGAQAQDYPVKPVRIIVPSHQAGPMTCPCGPSRQNCKTCSASLSSSIVGGRKRQNMQLICATMSRLAQRRDRGQAAAAISYIPDAQ